MEQVKKQLMDNLQDMDLEELIQEVSMMYDVLDINEIIETLTTGKLGEYYLDRYIRSSTGEI